MEGRRRLGILAGYFLAQIAFIFLASDAYHLRVDDAYYYFGIARRVVDTGMFSFDGIHLTNGFQALWQFLLIGVTYLARMAGLESPGQLVYVYFVVCAILKTAAASVAIDLARRFYPGDARQSWVFVFVALWFPGLTSSLLTGMENSVNWLLLLLLVRTLVGHDGSVGLPGAGGREFTTLVLVSTGAVYARLDNALILVIMALYFLVRRRDRGTRRTVLLWGGLTAVAVVPLFYWQWSTFGAAMPISGSVKMWKTAVSIVEYGIGAHAFESMRALLLSTAGLPIAAVVMGHYEIMKPIIAEAGLARVIAPAGAAIAVSVLAFVVMWKRGLLAMRRVPAPAALPFLTVVGVSHLAVSSVLFPEQWAYAGLIWYFLIENLAVFLVAGWLGGMLLGRMQGNAWMLTQRAGLIVWLLATAPMILWRPHAPTEQQLKRIGARWMNENLPDNAVVAAYNAGVTGYFASAPVVNLDGLVNDLHFFDEYLSRGHIRQYLVAEGVTHIADHSIPAGTPAWYKRWMHVPSEGRVLYRLEGNEPGMSFGVVRIDSLDLMVTRP